MKFSLIVGLWATSLSTVIAQSCSNLLIDDFSKWSTNINALGYYTSDDNSITGDSASNNTLSFKPSVNSYFYESTKCTSASTKGYTALQFTVRAPTSASVVIELQSKASCSASTYTSKFYTVTGLTGSTQVVTVPLTAFAGANLNAISAFVWESFSSTTAMWQFSQIQFICGSLSSSSSASSSTLSSSSTSTTSKLSTTVRSSSASITLSSSSSVATSQSSSTSRASVVSSTSASTSSRISSATSSAPSSFISSIRSSTTATSSTTKPTTASNAVCTPLLIDDYQSQSRLTFLFYNAMLQPSSDDATMKSVVVGQPSANHVTYTASSKASYFYSNFGCLNAQNTYGGISMRMKAPAGSNPTIQMLYGCGATPKTVDLTASQLGWTFDGTEKLYNVQFSKFAGLDLSQLNGILLTGLGANVAISLGPMAFYCGDSVQEYVVSSTSATFGPSPTAAAPTGSAPMVVIDTFAKKDSNSMGYWHGADDGMQLIWGTNQLKITSPDPDYAFYTQVSGGGCANIQSWNSGYLHVSYSGTTAFTVSLQQHNDACNDAILPYPGTWDSLEAARYASATDIYIPLSHFNIDFTKAIGFSFHGFYKPSEPLTLKKIEIVDSVPSSFSIPAKLPTGQLIFQCKRPNSFAFAIDDGSPDLAQQVLQIIKEEDIKVTFFTVGAPLLDPSTNLSNVYNEMLSQGHQLALHSYTHPKMEGLPSYEAIDWEYQQDIAAVQKVFNGLHTPYFRPPFGNEGARMRHRLGAALNTSDFYIVNWSVDVQDWLWAESSTPEKQLIAFQDSVSKGGNLVVMHYLYPSTVGYLRQFIRMAKATGKQLMRVDQCMMDPNAPPL